MANEKMDTIETVENIHNKAIYLAEAAFRAKSQGNEQEFIDLSEQAFNFELQAANKFKDEAHEPTRSILFRSAASLAYNAKKYEEAEKLVYIGLSGNPPLSVSNELKDLLEQVNFQRHLLLRGVQLEPNEFQLSLEGRGVGLGIALTDIFITKVQNLQNLIYRTAQRLSKISYSDSNSLGKSSRPFDLFLSVPRAGSFAVSLRLGTPLQPRLPGFDEPSPVIDEMLNCIEIFNSHQENVLRERINDDAYYRNFIGLARNIAPDGSEVNSIGFTMLRNGEVTGVSLTRKQKDISISSDLLHKTDVNTSSELIKITGKLLYANSLTREQIKIITDENQNITVDVPNGMMGEIVKPLWDTKVEIVGYFRRSIFQLNDIYPAEEVA